MNDNGKMRVVLATHNAGKIRELADPMADFGIEAPDAEPNNRIPTARVNIVERRAAVRKNDFDHVEIQMSFEEAMQEASRCLRCDHYGYGCVEGCDC